MCSVVKYESGSYLRGIFFWSLSAYQPMHSFSNCIFFLRFSEVHFRTSFRTCTFLLLSLSKGVESVESFTFIRVFFYNTSIILLKYTLTWGEQQDHQTEEHVSWDKNRECMVLVALCFYLDQSFQTNKTHVVKALTVCPLIKLSSNMWDLGTLQGTRLTGTNKQTIINKSIIQTSLYYIFKQRHCCVSSPLRLLLAPLGVFVSALCDVTKATDTSPGLLTAPPGPCGAVQGSVVRGHLQISTSLLLLQICWPWLRKQPYRLLMPGTYVFECICMQSLRHMQGFSS